VDYKALLRHASVVLSGIMLLSASACRADSTGDPGPAYGRGTDVLGVRLGIDGLDDVVALLGQASIRKEGDASTARSVVCYVATLSTGQVVVSFASDSELHGAPEFTVTNIEIEVAPARKAGQCGELNAKEGRSLYSLALLGKNRSEVLHELGVPSGQAGEELKFSQCEQLPLPESSEKYGYWMGKKDDCFEGKTPYLDACSGLTLVFSGDRLERITLSYVESIC
jgi:hypothetical protein